MKHPFRTFLFCAGLAAAAGCCAWLILRERRSTSSLPEDADPATDADETEEIPERQYVSPAPAAKEPAAAEGDHELSFAAGTDLDDDGVDDMLEVDSDGDGNVDTVYLDTTGDGLFDTAYVDTTGDQKFDTVLMDTNGDGRFDTSFPLEEEAEEEEDEEFLADESSASEEPLTRLNGEESPSARAVDLDGDGIPDALEVDTSGDGKVDTVYVDTTGDGEFDTVYRLKEEN